LPGRGQSWGLEYSNTAVSPSPILMSAIARGLHAPPVRVEPAAAALLLAMPSAAFRAKAHWPSSDQIGFIPSADPGLPSRSSAVLIQAAASAARRVRSRQSRTAPSPCCHSKSVSTIVPTCVCGFCRSKFCQRAITMAATVLPRLVRHRYVSDAEFADAGLRL
jgi:hypothetical protein